MMRTRVKSKKRNSHETTLGEVSRLLILGEYMQAVQLCELFDEKSITNAKYIFESHYARAFAYTRLGEYRLSRKHCEHAMQIAMQLEDTMFIARAKHSYSILFLAVQDFGSALEYELEYLSEMYRIENVDEQISSLIIVGGVYAYMGNYEKALECTEYARHLQEQHGKFDQKIAVEMQRSALYAAIKHDSPQAEKILLDLLPDEENSPVRTARILNALASVYIKQGRFDYAAKFSEKSRQLCKQNNLTSLQVKVLDNLCKALIETKYYAKLKPILHELHDLSIKLNNHLSLESSNMYMSVVSEQKQQYKQALEQYKQSKKHKGIVHSKEVLQKVNSLSTRIDILNAENQRRLRIKENEIIAKRIQLINKELTTHTLTIAQKNEMSFALFVQLQEITKSVKGSESRNALQQIMNELLSELDTEKSWSEFSEKFTSLHKTFLATLQQQYPNLSQTEQRMCALLKINLSTKDIANILGFEENTIEVYRKRIRKKMGLDKSVNLVTHIASL